MNNWPKDNYEAMNEFYGKITMNDNGFPSNSWERSFLDTVDVPYKMKLAWNQEHVVRQITVNKYCRKSLMNILSNIGKSFDEKKREELGLDLFGGCYCFRKRMGGKGLSVHSWAAAIDINPDGNQYGSKKWTMPDRVVDLFEEEGWQWGGFWKTPDAMHFQCTS